MTTLFGIPNCDTMKKARSWLAEHEIDYQFHDYKKAGINETLLHRWISQVGWETLLNRRGMMWRKLDETTRENINEVSAIELMLQTPSIIKRPVLQLDNGELFVGFKDAEYENIFQAAAK